MPENTHKGFNLATLRRHYTDPYALYQALRSHDSLYFDPSSRCWLVTSHSAITTILNDARFSSRLEKPGSSMHASIHKQMLFLDGERHQQAHLVIAHSLARITKILPERIRKFAQSTLLEHLATGGMDLVRDFASKISLLTIADVFGISTQQWNELQQLESWSDTFGDATSGYPRGNMQDIAYLEDYFRELIRLRRRNLGQDLMSAMIVAKDAFPEEELLANCMMVFAAGRFTVKKLIGNGVSLLFDQWPQIQKEFLQQPTVLPKLLGEELLRRITPTRSLIRRANTAVDIPEHTSNHAHTIQRDEHVLLFLEAGNHDPLFFPQPQQCQPLRQPNQHITFGYGSHQCPGAALARLEIQIALDVLLSLKELHPKPGSLPQWNPNPNLGGYISYPVLFYSV